MSPTTTNASSNTASFTVNSTRFTVELLNTTNYIDWKDDISIILNAAKLTDTTTEIFYQTNLKGKSDATLQKSDEFSRDQQTLALIRTAMSSTEKKKIRNIQHAYLAWEQITLLKAKELPVLRPI